MSNLWRLCLRGKGTKAGSKEAWALVHAYVYTHTACAHTPPCVGTYTHTQAHMPLGGRYLLRRCSSGGPHGYPEPAKENPNPSVGCPALKVKLAKGWSSSWQGERIGPTVHHQHTMCSGRLALKPIANDWPLEHHSKLFQYCMPPLALGSIY